MKKEKISVILPAYKAEDTIEEAIKSVLGQNYQNIEIIVVENGNKSGIEEICKKLSKEDIEKIKYIYNEEPNVSKARNIGIEQATGEYIAFIDADDKYEKNILETLINEMQKTGAQLVTCGYKTSDGKTKRRIDNTEKVKDTKNIQEYLEIVKENYLFNELWNKLYITEIIKQHNIKFNENFELGEDFIFNLDYLKWVKKASYINKELYIYTVGQAGLKLKYRDNKFEIEYELTKCLEEYYKEKGYQMDYIYNRFARVYYNGFLNVFQANNQLTKKEKEDRLERFISSKQYQEELNFLKDKITDKKFKIVVNQIFLKGKARIKLFIFLNSLRNR